MKRRIASILALPLFLFALMLPALALRAGVTKLTNPPVETGAGYLSFSYGCMSGTLTLVQGGGNLLFTSCDGSWEEIGEDGRTLYQRYRGSLNPAHWVSLQFSSVFPEEGTNWVHSHIDCYSGGDWVGSERDGVECSGTWDWMYWETPALDAEFDYSGLGIVDGVWLNFIFYSGDDTYELDIFLGNVPDYELEYCRDWDYANVTMADEAEFGNYDWENFHVDDTGSDLSDENPFGADTVIIEHSVDNPPSSAPLDVVDPGYDPYGDGVGDDPYDYHGYTEPGDANGSYSEGFFDLTEEEVIGISAAAGAVATGIALGAAGSGAGRSGGGGSGGEEQTYTHVDPATGAQSEYHYDTSTGEWISDDGRSVLNMDDIDRWKTDRMNDRKWADQANQDLRNRNTETDRQMDILVAREKQEAEAEKVKDVRDAIARKHGIYSGDEEAARRVMGADQRLNEIEQSRVGRELAWQEFKVGAAEVTQTAADIGVEALGEVTGPAGKHVVKNLYYAGKNLASNLEDARVNNKDMGAAFRKAVGETVVDITQNEVGSKSTGYQFAANSLGDAYKAALDAADRGTDITDAAVSGFIGGSAKTGLGAAFGSSKDSVYKDHLKHDAKILSNLRECYEGGQITQKTYQGARDLVCSTSANISRGIKAGYSAANSAANMAVDSAAKMVSGRTGD